MPIDFRKPRWLLLILVCLAGAIYSWYFFPSAFPILDVEITMDRGQALNNAESLAKQHDLGPKNFSKAASFNQDNDVQVFVELEAGGKDAFREMIRKDRYKPFQWHVRLFKEGETRETTIRFTPDGVPYGFKEKWPEDDSGPALQSSRAKQIAEEEATGEWNVELKEYELISSGQKERSSGRVDHTFLYEKPNISIGEGKYRLRLTVSGNELSEITRFVKVPEAFSRRYENMRSANSLIQSIGTTVLYVLYLLIGCLLGAYWLVRKNALKWKMPLVWGGGITLLMVLAKLNRLPLAWMQYDTALTPGSFLTQQIVQALTSTATFGALITISFVAAEGLTRLAFDHHPRLWKLWNPEAASSKTVMSLTTFGYVLVGLYFSYKVALYSYAHDALGWWTPSNLLYNPNILAHYLPWLEPVVNSLRAGFWEECLFRAVPLAGAALLGQYFGGRRWWIGIALPLQAVIFGAGHAAYATQPSYARVVELTFSSTAMGIIYLGYGLLPTVIIHFIYDLILMALPIFVSESAWIWLSQGTVVAIGLIPLLVVLFSWFAKGRLSRLSEKYFNRGWSPDTEQEEVDYSFPVPPAPGWKKTIMVGLIGLVGLGLWWQLGNFTTYETPLKIDRERAEEKAKDLLRKEGNDPGEWMVVSSVSGDNGADDAFVWQKGDESAYKKLMDRYLVGPYWTVRFMTFQGSVAERAEEYRVRLSPEANFSEVEHQIPEADDGDSLTESVAQSIADSVVINRYGHDPAELKKLSAEPQPRPNRRDWTFTYEVPDDYPMDEGEARISVNIAGSEVTDASRYVHVPEQFKRDRRSRLKILGLVESSGQTVLLLLMLAGAVAGIYYWGSDYEFHSGAALTVFSLFLTLTVLKTLNGWPSILAGLNTAKPFWNQVIMALAGRIPKLFSAGIYGLIAGFVHGQISENKNNNFSYSLVIGVGLGLIGAALLTTSNYLVPELAPNWGSYQALDKAVPLMHASLGAINTVLSGTLILLLFSVAQHRLTEAGNAINIIKVAGIVLFGIVIGSTIATGHLYQWLFAGSALGVLFLVVALLILPYDRSFVPMAMCTLSVLGQIQNIVTSEYVYGVFGSSIAIVLVLTVAVYWTYMLNRSQEYVSP